MKTAVRRIVSVGILLILLFAMQRLVMPKDWNGGTDTALYACVNGKVKCIVKVFNSWQRGMSGKYLHKCGKWDFSGVCDASQGRK